MSYECSLFLYLLGHAARGLSCILADDVEKRLRIAGRRTGKVGGCGWIGVGNEDGIAIYS